MTDLLDLLDRLRCYGNDTGVPGALDARQVRDLTGRALAKELAE